jgi:hypothetical protein
LVSSFLRRSWSLGENYGWAVGYRFDVDLGVDDLLEEFHAVVVMEGGETGDHLEDEAAETPPIDLYAVALFADDFWGEVLWGATDGLGFVFLSFEDLGEAEVSQFDVAGFVDDDVLGFETE